MDTNVERLRREIEELERQIAAHPFEGLFDKKRADQMYQKLKKKRRELEREESAVGAAVPDSSGELRPVMSETVKEILPVPPAIAGKQAIARPEAAPIGKEKARGGDKRKKAVATRSKAKVSAAASKTGKKPPVGKAKSAPKRKVKATGTRTAAKPAAKSKKKK